MKFSLLFLLTLAALGLSGCAAWNEMQTAQTEQSLLAAGFKILPADTPGRRASLAALKPYQMHRKIKGGSLYYLYPDPKQGALYIGNQRQYSAYQGNTLQQQLAEEQLLASNSYAANSLGWNDWNIWGAGW